MKLYKVLASGQKSCNGGDAQWIPGEWMPSIEEIEPCKSGYHLCRRQDLIHWLNEEIWEAEYQGEMIIDDNKIVVQQARITKRIDTWNERTARLFAADCAENVLYVWEKKYPDNKTPHNAILAARSYANGKIDYKELDAAWDAAMDAARDWQTELLFKYLHGEII